ncbi:L,D-transpeptidase family protein [Marinobacter salinisoli]|uniref:L,D-transpeptidase family protein n=1 Tax=Marinobacter salinisoli TaxID=2769486 RepID=A0ABX7MRA3_9GAMM|nr:L,D-transpeptidase family protein [Marinobacter salinisoli]QSP94718.1 L,D-transpeptidase family protein [Marinobacter salinisoli]
MPVSSAPARAALLIISLLILACQSSRLSADEAIVNRVEALDTGFPVEVLGNPLLARKALSSFYSARQYEPAWQSPAARQQLIRSIRAIGQEGLAPEDYHSVILSELATGDMSQYSPDLRADLDMLLSDAFLLLSSHLLEGKVNPRTRQPDWSASDRTQDIVAALATALATEDVSGALARLRPAHPGYRQLVDARQQMTPLLGRSWLPIAFGPVIRPGDRDDRLPEIRRRLRALTDLADREQRAPPSNLGAYTPEMKPALATFQARHGLAPDGLIGPQTLQALNMLPIERVRQIDASLERWRWLPEALGERYVLVNIAGYSLTVVDDGMEIQHQKVIVGQPFRQTPVFSDRIRYLVLNPDWTIPRKLVIADQLPRIIRDPNYLARMNIRVYQGWGANRQEVDPATVPWAELTPDAFPYHLVQQPGPQNALGRIKFMFPNRYAVYLHDTPGQQLFGRIDRTFSSGCIRVEKPFLLAQWLLSGDPEWTDATLTEAVASERTQTVTLPNPVPVYIQYWTAWVDNSGQLQIRTDIYNRDGPLISALRQTPSGDTQRMTPVAIVMSPDTEERP